MTLPISHIHSFHSPLFRSLYPQYPPLGSPPPAYTPALFTRYPGLDDLLFCPSYPISFILCSARSWPHRRHCSSVVVVFLVLLHRMERVTPNLPLHSAYCLPLWSYCHTHSISHVLLFHVDIFPGFGMCLFTSSYPQAPCRMFYDYYYISQVLSSKREMTRRPLSSVQFGTLKRGSSTIASNVDFRMT